MSGPHLQLGVALDGTGWHPAAWREPSARPDLLAHPGYWVDLVGAAERGGLDLVTFEDAFTLQSDHPFRPDDRTDRVRGRLDAHLVATYVAPTTTCIGLVPTITTTHTEPFHVSIRVASLDVVSGGRAGWRVQVAKQPDEARLFGRRELPAAAPGAGRSPLLDEAADAVEVARRLWDSWEDDAEIRDVATGRFIDRDRLHHIDFEGPHFSVRGPSITPRPPQGQPVVTLLAHVPEVIELAARSADVVFVTPADAEHLRELVAQVRAAEDRVARPGPPLLVHADVTVLLADDPRAARVALQRLDDLVDGTWRTDTAVVADTPAGAADLLQGWHAAGADGIRLRPARLPVDLDAIVERLVPELAARGLRGPAPAAATLRERLGLERPANRYAAPAPAVAS